MESFRKYERSAANELLVLSGKLQVPAKDIIMHGACGQRSILFINKFTEFGFHCDLF
jgi:hypothetical protein